MRFLFLLLVGLSFCNLSQALVHPPVKVTAFARVFSTTLSENLPEDFVPYPWGFELPFPWTLAQGIWVVKTAHYNSFFTFQVVRERSSNERQLMIRQYDPATCTEVAAGVGVERSNKVIWAQMKAYNSPNAYRLGLRSFNVDDFPKGGLPATQGQVMVLSLAQIDSVQAKHYPLAKISNSFKDISSQCQVTTP